MVGDRTTPPCIRYRLSSFTRSDLDQPTLGCDLGRYIGQRHSTQNIKDRNITLHVLQGAVPNLDGL